MAAYTKTVKTVKLHPMSNSFANARALSSYKYLSTCADVLVARQSFNCIT